MTIKNFFDTNTLQLLVYKLDGSLFLTFDYNDIIKESIKCTDNLMSSINSGSCSIAISVKDSEKVDSLLAYNGELKVTLSSNNIVAFKGYLSNKTSLSVNSYGIPSVSLTLEDIGTKLFKKELYPDSLVDHYFTGTLKDFVELIKTQLGGLEYSSTEIANETRTISSLISSSSTIETLLKQVCLELGYVYYFNAGVLTFFKIPTDATSSQTVSSFAMNGTTAINVSKEIRKYKTCRVQTEVYENASNVLIYRDNSGGSDSGNCEVEIEGKSHYPALSDTEEPAQYEANDIESGKEIISISNLKPLVKYTGGKVTNTITQNGSKTITVDLYNDSTATAKVTRLECRADVVRVASTEVVKTSIATESQESDNVYELNCSWIHTKADCETIAKTIGSYFNYCDTKYTFYVRDDETTYSSSPFRSGLVGKVITLKEDSISGLDVLVLVTGAVYNTNANYTQYTAVGYSKFNMTATTISSSTKSQESNKTGVQGVEGIGTKAYIAKDSQTESWWTANCSVGNTNTFSSSSSLRNDCRIGDYFVVTGTSTEGKAHTAIFQSTTSTGDLTGICVASFYADRGLQGLQGIQGPTGEQGIAGKNGTDGKTTYFHIKYSEVANPTSSSQMTETPSTYIGTYVDYTEADSTDPTKYSWSQFKGSQGEQGIAGKNGTDGKTQYLHIKYSNDGGSTFTGNSGEDVGDYIGQCTDFNSSDPTTVSSYKWSKIKGETGETGAKGAKGEVGNTGNGISSIVEYYAVSTSNTSVTSSWGPSVPTLTATNKYLWNYEVITYTDSSKKETAKRVIGVYGDKGATGAKGDTGATGNGISSITNYYLATTSSSGVTRSTSGWSTTIQTITATKKYLWNYEDILYTNGNHSYSTPSIIGVYGDKGETGATGAKGATGEQGPQGPQGPQGEKGDSATTYVTLTSGYNLNSCITKDCIYVSSSTAICNSLLNKPSNFLAGEVRLEVEWLGSNNYLTQYLYCKSGSATRYYYRTYSSGTFGSWVELGTQGARGYTVVTTRECAISTSSSLSESEQAALTWTNEANLNWSYGYYIYRRTMSVVTETSAVTYTYNGRDTELENKYNSLLSFSIKADRYTYIKNRRAGENEVTTITISIDDRYYNCDSYTWTLNGETLTPTESEGKYSFTIPVKTAENSYTLTVLPYKGSNSIDAISTSLIFTVIDKTEKSIFFGAVNALTNAGTGTFLLDGDGCFLTQDDGDNTGNLVYVYQNGSWVEFNNCTLTDDEKTVILSKAQETALKYANLEGNTLSASYAYLGTLIADYISARSIGAETIVLTGDSGKMVGGDYETVDSEGYLTSKGLYLDSAGNAKFNDAKLKNCKIDSGEINNITITGKIDNDVLTTTLADVVADKISMGSISSSDIRYLGSQAKTLIRSKLATKDTIYSYSGIYNGVSFNKIVDSTGTTSSPVISSYTTTNTININDSSKGYLDYICLSDKLMYLTQSAVKYSSSDSNIYFSSDGGTTWTMLKASVDSYAGTQNIYFMTGWKSGNYYYMVGESTYACRYEKRDSAGTLIKQGYWESSAGMGNIIFVNNVAIRVNASSIDYSTYTRPFSISVFSDSFPTVSGTYDIGSLSIRKDNGSPYFSSSYFKGAYFNGKYYLNIPTTGKYITSTNLSTWTVNNNLNGWSCDGFYNLNGKLFFVGNDWDRVNQTTNRYLYYSTDGTNWNYCLTLSSDAIATPRITREPFYKYGYYYFADKRSQDLVNWESSGIDFNGRLFEIGDKIFTAFVNTTYTTDHKVYCTQFIRNYMPSGLHFLNSNNEILTKESSLTDYLTNAVVSLKNGSTSLIDLPTTIPSSMNSYRRIPTLFSTTQSYKSLSNATIGTYTRYNTATNAEETISAFNDVPDSVNISPTSFSINGVEKANSSWWIKNITSLTGSVTPIGVSKGVLSDDLNAKTATACIGKTNPFDQIIGNAVYNAVWNDICDCITVDCELTAGYCYSFDGTHYYKSDRYADKGFIGIHSDTAGFYVGHKEGQNELQVAIGGFVLAYVDKDYKVGTPLTCTKDGILTALKPIDRVIRPHSVVATYWKNETAEEWGSDSKKVKVNGRKWVKIR